MSSGTDGVTVSVDVAVTPEVAFDAFTRDIDAWYERGPYSFNDPDRAVAVHIEPGVGGRWVEVWDEATGEGFEVGRILVWEPPERFVMSYRSFKTPDPVTEIEVRFDPVAEGTRVTLEHRGFERVPPEQVDGIAGARVGWGHLLRWFEDEITKREARSRS